MTDRRGLRRLDPELAPVELMLLRWGDWARTTGAFRVPVAPRNATLLARIIREGLVGASHVAAAPEARIPAGIAQTDAAVAKLRAHLQDAVRVHYVFASEIPLEAQAHRLQVSEATLSYRLQTAREVLSHLLELAV